MMEGAASGGPAVHSGASVSPPRPTRQLPQDTGQALADAAASNVALIAQLERAKQEAEEAGRRLRAARDSARQLQQERTPLVEALAREAAAARRAAEAALRGKEEEEKAKLLLAQLCEEKQRKLREAVQHRRSRFGDIDAETWGEERACEKLAAEVTRLGELLATVSAAAKMHQRAGDEAAKRSSDVASRYGDDLQRLAARSKEVEEVLQGVQTRIAEKKKELLRAETEFRAEASEIERRMAEAAAEIVEEQRELRAPLRAKYQEQIREVQAQIATFEEMCESATMEELHANVEQLQLRSKLVWEQIVEERAAHQGRLERSNQQLRELRDELDLLTGDGEPGPGGAKPQTIRLYSQLQQERVVRLELLRQQKELQRTADQQRHRLLLLRSAHAQLAAEESPEGLRWDAEGNPVPHGLPAHAHFPGLAGEQQEGAPGGPEGRGVGADEESQSDTEKVTEKPPRPQPFFDHPPLPHAVPPALRGEPQTQAARSAPSSVQLERLNAELSRVSSNIAASTQRLEILEVQAATNRDPLVRDALISEIQQVLQQQLLSGVEVRQGMRLAETGELQRLQLPAPDGGCGLVHATGDGFQTIEGARVYVAFQVVCVAGACVIEAAEARMLRFTRSYTSMQKLRRLTAGSSVASLAVPAQQAVRAQQQKAERAAAAATPASSPPCSPASGRVHAASPTAAPTLTPSEGGLATPQTPSPRAPPQQQPMSRAEAARRRRTVQFAKTSMDTLDLGPAAPAGGAVPADGTIPEDTLPVKALSASARASGAPPRREQDRAIRRIRTADPKYASSGAAAVSAEALNEILAAQSEVQELRDTLSRKEYQEGLPRDERAPRQDPPPPAPGHGSKEGARAGRAASLDSLSIQKCQSIVHEPDGRSAQSGQAAAEQQASEL